MKKTISNIRTLAALLMAGAAFTACSNSDDIINEQPVNNVKQGYILTVSASKDGNATRALTDDNGAIVASWETTDEIVVTKNGTEVGTLSPTTISGLNAIFSGTIDGEFATSDVLTLTYHPIDGLSGFASQDGTLNGSDESAENYDMAVATATISGIDGNNITISESSVTFANQTAVVVLSPHASYQDPCGTTNISSLTVSVTMNNIPVVGSVTEKFGPFTLTGGQPYYFSLPSQSLLAEVLAAKYSLSASAVSTLLASATITFTGQQGGVYYLTCSKTGYKFAAGKYYKLDENNFVMTEVTKRSAAGKDVYVSSSNTAWSNTVTFAVNKEIGWKVEDDNVYCGDKQLYVEYDEGLDHIARWVKASDGHIPSGATYTLIYTKLNGGEVLHVGDIINVPDGEEWELNGDYYIISDYNPYTVVRANITGDPGAETVTEAEDGAYYVIKSNTGEYFLTFASGLVPATATSDGILVTYKGIPWDGCKSYTFSVHEPEP